MGKHNEFGKKGEGLAKAHLIEAGYEILACNYRYLKAEIDIICRKEGILAIVEVKSRNSAYVENIADTVTKRKIKLLVMAADHYVVSHNLDLEVRFDIITILRTKKGYEITHLESAFYHF